MTQKRHHFHSPWKRALYSFVLVSAVLVVGMIGMHRLEGMDWLDAFYFMSMLATAQGPASTPLTSAGKIFASIMAYLSVGTAVTGLGFLFGPFLGQLWRIGHDKFEDAQKKSL